MTEFWNNRYGLETYAYGTEPNEFFKENVLNYKPSGRILLPAEGEGRNAVFAAQYGLDVTAFDLSEEGKKKALKLAGEKQVEIIYHIGPLEDLGFKANSFDLTGLIYAHFPPNIRMTYHQEIVKLLQPGGLIIFEAFSKRQLEYNTKNPAAGGPKSLEMLFSVEEIKVEFQNVDVLYLSEEVVSLREGQFHNGESAVIRFIGRKR